MVIDVTLFVTEVYQAEKRHYVSGAVVGGAGGMLKLAVDGIAPETTKAGVQLHFKGLVKPGLSKSGQFLSFVG